MVERQCRRRGIQDPRTLAALGRVPRHSFVRPAARGHAYADFAMEIGHEQTISQPYIVACMTEAGALRGYERVLDVGTGSGYQAAVLAELASEVHSIERIPELAAAAAERLAALDYCNVQVHVGDGSLGWPQAAPFDAILVAAASPTVPAELGDQLAEGGRLVIPVGGGLDQELVVITRDGERFRRRPLCPARFVPLIGAAGFPAAR